MRGFDRRLLIWSINGSKWNPSVWIHGFRFVFWVIGWNPERFADLLQGLKKEIRLKWIWSLKEEESLIGFRFGFKVTSLDSVPRKDLADYGSVLVIHNGVLIFSVLIPTVDKREWTAEEENKNTWESRLLGLKLLGFTMAVVVGVLQAASIKVEEETSATVMAKESVCLLAYARSQSQRLDVSDYGSAVVNIFEVLIVLFLVTLVDRRVLTTEAENEVHWKSRFLVLRLSGFTMIVVLGDLQVVVVDVLFGEGDEEIESRVLNSTMRSSFASFGSCISFGYSRLILRVVSNGYGFHIWFSLFVFGFDVRAFNGGLQWFITKKEEDSSQSELMWMVFSTYSLVVSQICSFDSLFSIWENVLISLLFNFGDDLVPNWVFGKHIFGIWFWRFLFVFHVTLYMLNDLVFCFPQSFETEDQVLFFNWKIWVTRLQNLEDHGNEDHNPTHYGTVKGFTGGRNPPNHKVDK